MHLTARSKNIEPLEPLLEKGAVINDRYGYYGTALHNAAFCESITEMDILLQHGAKTILLTSILILL